MQLQVFSSRYVLTCVLFEDMFLVFMPAAVPQVVLGRAVLCISAEFLGGH